MVYHTISYNTILCTYTTQCAGAHFCSKELNIFHLNGVKHLWQLRIFFPQKFPFHFGRHLKQFHKIYLLPRTFPRIGKLSSYVWFQSRNGQRHHFSTLPNYNSTLANSKIKSLELGKGEKMI